MDSARPRRQGDSVRRPVRRHTSRKLHNKASPRKAKRAVVAHPVDTPSCCNKVKVVADRPRNTPTPAAGINPCASLCKPLRVATRAPQGCLRSEEHTSELQSLMRISYAVFCLKKKKQQQQ